MNLTPTEMLHIIIVCVAAFRVLLIFTDNEIVPAEKQTPIIPTKKQTKTIAVETIDPAYNKFVSQETISKLKINMVNEVSKVQNISVCLNSEEKVELISGFIGLLPILLKNAIRDNNDTIYVIGSSLELLPQSTLLKHMPKRHNNIAFKTVSYYDRVFVQISSDLSVVLKQIGINSTMISDKTLIKIKTEELMKFCNYGKLASLK